MKKFVLKSHKNKFVEYKIEHGIKVFLTGKYSNINILDAINNEGYDRETQNVVSLEELKETPIVTDDKYWDEYSDEELKKSHEEILKIKKEMKKYNVDKDNKFEILAFLYQYFQFSVKYYDILERAKFPEFDDIYLLYKNDNFYSALVEQYSSSRGICEMFKIMCNYFDIACDSIKVKTPKEQYINKVYFENGEISYLSLADEIGLKDAYYTFPKRKMQKRDKCLEKENLSYEYFLIDKDHFIKHHQNTKTMMKKGKDFPFHWKKMLFDKINQTEQKEKTEETKDKKRNMNVSLEPLKNKIQENKEKKENKRKEKLKITEQKQKEKLLLMEQKQLAKEKNKQILEEKRKKVIEAKKKKQKEKEEKRKELSKSLKNKISSIGIKMLIPYQLTKESIEKIKRRTLELSSQRVEKRKEKEKIKIKKQKENQEKRLRLIKEKEKRLAEKKEIARINKERKDKLKEEKARKDAEKAEQKQKEKQRLAQEKEERRQKELQLVLENQKKKQEEKRKEEEKKTREKEEKRQKELMLALEKEKKKQEEVKRKEQERIEKEQERKRLEEERIAREQEKKRLEEERIAREQEEKNKQASIVTPIVLASTYEMAKSNKNISSKQVKKTREVQIDNTRKTKEPRKVAKVYEKVTNKFKNLKVYPKLIEIELMKSKNNSKQITRKIQEQDVKKLVKKR